MAKVRLSADWRCLPDAGLRHVSVLFGRCGVRSVLKVITRCMGDQSSKVIPFL